MKTRPACVEPRRNPRLSTFLACAAIATSGLGCGAGADPQIELALATACTRVTAGGAWWNQPFAAQTGLFHVELTATPSASSIDAVVGLGDGSAASFAALAAIVRFNPAGTIDVRSGSSYQADLVQRYDAGTAYRVRLDLDVAAHTYSVWVAGATGGYVRLARGYPFRTEQAAVTRLSTAAAKVDSATGALEVCGVTLVADPTTMIGCLVARAGSGFATTTVPDVTVLGAASFNVFASAPGIDAVIGLSADPPARFSDLATAVRLAPSGQIDVRDGDGYRADVADPYGTTRRGIELVADVTSHTYSVFDFSTEVARQYRFRTEQRAVSHLQRLSVIVDGSEGSIAVCDAHATRSVEIAYSREGAHAVVALANDQALLDDGTTVRRVDAAGQTIAQRASGGLLAADAAGNVFSARVTGSTLTVDKADPSFAPRWGADRAVAAGTQILAIASDPRGGVVVAHTTPGDPRVTVFGLNADGGFGPHTTVPGGAIALDGDQPIVAWGNDPVRISPFAATGNVLWTRSFAGRAAIASLAVDPLHNVVFGGTLLTAIDFGGGTIPLITNGDGQAWDGFVVKLSAAGAHVFSEHTFTTWVTEVASNGPRVAVSGTELVNFVRPRLRLFDAAGTPTPWPGDLALDSDLGNGNRVAIGASGRIWWNLSTRFQPGDPAFWPYLLVLRE